MKIKLKYDSVARLCEIDRYIRQYGVYGADLPHAASDVLDGAVDREDIAELIFRRLLTILHEYPGSIGDSLCGRGWTVHLTKRAVDIFWPERRAATEETHP